MSATRIHFDSEFKARKVVARHIAPEPKSMCIVEASSLARSKKGETLMQTLYYRETFLKFNDILFAGWSISESCLFLESTFSGSKHQRLQAVKPTRNLETKIRKLSHRQPRTKFDMAKFLDFSLRLGYK